MSLAGAMNSAVSALKAQSQALAMVSDNLANSSTTGYKAVTTSFKSLVTQQYSTTTYPSGGVTSSVRQNVGAQGLISGTTNSTDLALDGTGFFVVTYGLDSKQPYFTRNGEFEVDKNGYLCLGNYYLQGWETDADGNVLLSSSNSTGTLSPINVNRYSGIAAATENVAVKANLPAGASVGDTETATMEVIDSLGESHTVTMTYEKTASNEWELSFSDPVLSSDATTTTGTISGGPYTITFDSDGNLSAITDSLGNPTTVSASITGWTTGAAASTVAVDIGSSGSGNRLTQKGTEDAISVTSITGDGIEYGNFTDVSVAADGTVMANYDNGQSLAIYKLAVATFNNVNGLSALSGGVYEETVASGGYTLHEAGKDGVATVTASALEASTVDTGDEFTRMIVAQQAYSAASQVINTTKDMFDELISAVR